MDYNSAEKDFLQFKDLQDKSGQKGEVRQAEYTVRSDNTMDEKDKNIIIFGGDEDADEYDYIDSPQDVDAEVLPYDVSPDEYIENDETYQADDSTEQPLSEEDEYMSARSFRYGIDDQSGETFDHNYGKEDEDSSYSAPDYSSSTYTYNQPGHSKNDNKKYVTKTALVVCMILTMLVSSVLGSLFGALMGKGNDSDSGAGSNEDLSQLSLSDATDSDLTIAEIVAKNENAVVEILVSSTTQDFFGQSQVTEGAGSGVIVNSNGYIVTNYHVIEGATKVQVTLHNGDTYAATIVGGDSDNDIAVIKIDAKDLTIAEIGDSDTVQVGDTAVAIGNPLGQLGGTATTGIISALDRNLTIDGRTLSLLQTDAAINGGNSGGGLFNSKGELIGIVDAKSSGVGIEGLAFAIPINAVKDIINDLIENGKVSEKPAIGIMIQDVSEDNAQYYNLESAGVYVAQVTSDNAQKAGFQQGDRIVSFNGEEIKSGSDLISKVRKCKIGDTVTVVVSRSGQEIEIKTVLSASTAQE